MTRAEGRGLGACITRADERVQRLRVEEGQITGQHQPGRAGMLAQCRADAGNRALDAATIDDLRIARACAIVALLGAHRHECSLDPRREKSDRRVEL